MSGGTARYMSMGGAFSALGGDFSTLSVNPAGIGIYRSNEFTFTPTLDFIKTTTDPEFDFGATDSKANFNLNNVGYITTTETGRDKGLLSYNIGFGFNRLQNFHKAYRINSPGANYSLTDALAMQLNDVGYDDASYGAQLGYDSYLLNESLVGGIYGSPLLSDAQSDYVKDVTEEGHINEWLLSFGGNISDVLYFGATLGLRDIKHQKDYLQSETFIDNEFGEAYQRPDPVYGDTAVYSSLGSLGSYVDGFDYNSTENTNGFGMNLKVGFIVKPLDFLRVGLAVHAPSYNWINVDYSGGLLNESFYLVTSPDDVDYGKEFYGKNADLGYNDYYSEEFKYRIVSPYKVNLSTALIIGKFLAIDVEGDVVGYDQMKIKDLDGRSASPAIVAANNDIESMYKVAYNARAGAEFRVGGNISLRAGYAFYGSPYKDEMNNVADYVGNRYSLSGGAGFRSGDFFLDLAYVQSHEEGNTFIYDDASDAYSNIVANTEMINNRFMMTMGFKF